MVPPVYESQSFTSSELSEQGLTSSVQSLNNWMAQQKQQKELMLQEDLSKIKNYNIDIQQPQNGTRNSLYRSKPNFQNSPPTYEQQKQYQQQLSQQNEKLIQQQLYQKQLQQQQSQNDREGTMRRSLSYDSLILNDKIDGISNFKDTNNMDGVISQDRFPVQMTNSLDSVKQGNLFKLNPQKLHGENIFRKRSSKSSSRKRQEKYGSIHSQPQQQTYPIQENHQQQQQQQQQQATSYQEQNQQNILKSKPISLLGSSHGQNLRQQIDSFNKDNLDSVVRAMSEIDLQRSKIITSQIPVNDTLLPFAALAVLILALIGLCLSIT